MKLTGIIAISKDNRVIGKNNDLPWGHKYKEDLKFFKEKTMDKQLIMGRKTYEGLGVPHLKGRTIWVMTRTNSYGWHQMFSHDGRPLVNIFERFEQLPDMEYMVAGGLSIYNELMPKLDEFFVTYINESHDGDTVMPPFEQNFAKSESVLVTPHFEIKRLFERTNTNVINNS